MSCISGLDRIRSYSEVLRERSQLIMGSGESRPDSLKRGEDWVQETLPASEAGDQAIRGAERIIQENRSLTPMIVVLDGNRGQGGGRVPAGLCFDFFSPSEALRRRTCTVGAPNLESPVHKKRLLKMQQEISRNTLAQYNNVIGRLIDGRIAISSAFYPLLQEALAVNRNVLDLGCGSGDDALHLALQGAEVTGIDNHPAALTEDLKRVAQRFSDILAKEDRNGCVRLCQQDMRQYMKEVNEQRFGYVLLKHSLGFLVPDDVPEGMSSREIANKVEECIGNVLKNAGELICSGGVLYCMLHCYSKEALEEALEVDELIRALRAPVSWYEAMFAKYLGPEFSPIVFSTPDQSGLHPKQGYVVKVVAKKS